MFYGPQKPNYSNYEGSYIIELDCRSLIDPSKVLIMVSARLLRFHSSGLGDVHISSGCEASCGSKFGIQGAID